MAIEIGTAACEPGTVAGEIHDGFEDLYGVDAASSATVKGVAFSIAQGVIEGIRTQIADTEAIVRDGLTLTGGEAGGGGGGAPSDAQYITAASNGTLSAERVATSTATVTCDFSTPGQAKFNVVDGTTTTKGVVELATDGQTDAGVVVQGNDSRLAAATESTRGTVELATSAETTAGLAVQASDPRLSDDRDPTAHAISHQNAGGDEISVAGLSGLLADGQTPLAHASSHMSAGADPIRIDELKVGTDVTTLDASTGQHGLMPKLSGDSGEFYNGAGAQVIPEGSPKTIYELDWAAQATQLGLADGTVTVDGVNWTAANAATASVFRILNGSGLQMVANSGSSRTWTGGTLTSPSLRVPFEDLAAEAARYRLTLTVWSYFSFWSLPFSQNAIIAGCYAPAGAVYTAAVSGTGFVHNAVDTYPMIQRGTSFNAAAAIGTSFDVLVWRFCAGGTVDAWAGVWSSGWPTALTPIGNDVNPSGSTIVTTAQLRRAGSTLIYSPATRSASGTPTFTLANTRIQIG